MATRITADYGTHTKDELLAEIDARRAEGETIDGAPATLKDDLIAALDLSDHSKTPPTPTQSKPLKSKFPSAPIKPLDLPPAAGEAPPDSAYKESPLFVKTGDPTKEQYMLAVVDGDSAALGRTHFLKNQVHFDNLTEAEFKQKYETAK